MPDAAPLRVLREHERSTSGGAAYDDLEIGPVPDGEDWLVEWVSCVDETNAIIKRAVGVKVGGSVYWLKEEAITTSGLIHGWRVVVPLSAGESLVLRLTGCTSSDVIKAWAVGEYLEVRE